MKYQDKLSHLSTAEVEDLMTLYYEGEKNSLLIAEYNIDIRSALLSKTFPLKVHIDSLCEYCNIPMYSYRPSKSSYSAPNMFCKSCGHEENTYHCRCSNCQEKREVDEKRRQVEQKENYKNLKNIILEKYLEEKQYPINIKELDVKTYLYICSLLRACLSESTEVIEPLSQSKLNLAPTGDYRRKIISNLRKNNIILFSPDTDPSSVIIEDESISRYYPDEVSFKLNIQDSEYEKTIDDLLHLKNELNYSPEEIINIWKDIALNECLEFLYARLDEYNLPSENIGEKTISSIKSALCSFSTSQLYYFIWTSVKNAAAFYQKERISKKHAVNTIAGNISRSSEKAVVEGWDIKEYGRDYNYPQTIISEVFFNKILRVGSKGFISLIPDDP